MSSRLGLLFVLCLLAGCQPTMIRFTQSTAVPAAVQTSALEIEIPTGVAVAVHAVPVKGNEPVESDVQVIFEPRDKGIIGIRAVKGKDFPFVIFGISEGTTTIDVTVDSGMPTQIKATVTRPVDVD